MKQLIVVALVVLTVLALALIVQNTETVDTKLLFITLSMPRAVLLLITAGIGYAAGLISAIVVFGRKAGKKMGEVAAQ